MSVGRAPPTFGSSRRFAKVFAVSEFDILGFTWLLLSRYGRNDGLVTEESAKWGNFRGVYESKRIRGISHGDTIDLKSEDYKGYDPREAYVEIVSELKDMGY